MGTKEKWCFEQFFYNLVFVGLNITIKSIKWIERMIKVQVSNFEYNTDVFGKEICKLWKNNRE